VSRTRIRLLFLTLTVAAGAILVVELAGSGSAGRAPSPGVSAGVAALDRLPPATDVPQSVVQFVDFVAPQRDSDPKQALAHIRRLRSGLGKTRADLYAFRSGTGAPCFILVGEVGACARSATDGTPGLQWTIGGGMPGNPSDLVAIASDDVAAVGLAVDGTPVPVSLANNVAFAEYAASARHAQITIVRHDGTTGTVEIQLEPPGSASADLRLERRSGRLSR
jgi:hypothetical protein